MLNFVRFVCCKAFWISARWTSELPSQTSASSTVFSKGEADAWTVVLHANLHAGLLGPCGFCFLVVSNMSNNDVYNVPDDGAVLLSSMFTCKWKCVSRFKSTTWVSLERFLDDRFWSLCATTPAHLWWKSWFTFFCFYWVFLLLVTLEQSHLVFGPCKGATTLSTSFSQHFFCFLCEDIYCQF